MSFKLFFTHISDNLRDCISKHDMDLEHFVYHLCEENVYLHIDNFD